MTSSHQTSPQQRETMHPLPTPPSPPIYEDGELPSDPENPLLQIRLPGEDGAASPATGRIVLDISLADLTIRPGPAGEPIRLEADFDENAFELSEALTTADDGTWTYDLSFGARGGFFGLLFKGGHSGTNRLELIVPRGHPLDLVGRIGMGKSETDLGGLWVGLVDLELGMGDHLLEVREPLPFPMQALRMKSAMGNFELHSLGDASPALIEIDHSMGDLRLDLEGNWRNDAHVKVELGMGSGRLWLPDNAKIDIAKMSLSMGEKTIDHKTEKILPPDAPTLTLEMSGSMGEWRIER